MDLAGAEPRKPLRLRRTEWVQNRSDYLLRVEASDASISTPLRECALLHWRLALVRFHPRVSRRRVSGASGNKGLPSRCGGLLGPPSPVETPVSRAPQDEGGVSTVTSAGTPRCKAPSCPAPAARAAAPRTSWQAWRARAGRTVRRPRTSASVRRRRAS
jgi:hypothetical protein